MAASSSSSAVPGQKVWLYDPSFTRVAIVLVSNPLPPIVVYAGLYYAWSNIHWAYMQTVPYQATLSTSPQEISVVANPQF